MAAEVKSPEVKEITSISTDDGTRIGWGTKVTIIKVDDPANGVICYGMISGSSDSSGRSLGGGYPGTAISCVPVPVLRK